MARSEERELEREMNREIPEYKGELSLEFIARMKEALDDYKSQKGHINDRIAENNAWYAAQYGRMVDRDKNTTEPATAFIFNAITNKYADAVDNYPQPNFLEREKGDADTARILTGVVPVILEQSKFKRVYKRDWLSKLKHGTGIYGVFYDEDEGKINIRDIDIMDFYCDTHVKGVQDSPFVFVESTVPNDELRALYPKYAALFFSTATEHLGDGTTAEIKYRTKIYDCYYKKYTDSGYVVHMAKMADGHILEATEDIKTETDIDDLGREVVISTGYEKGLYDHGKYPFVLDVLYPDDSCIFGLGVVDMIKNPQMYIDKLDGTIAKNAMLSGKKRFMIKDNCGINEQEFIDASVDIIHCAGSPAEENVREFQVSPLAAFIVEHRENKINELKEIIGNRDFQQGGTSGGVTAASAISVLQQAGEKISRAVIDDSYDAYKEVIEMVVELLRQFMTEQEVFRITNEQGGTEYTNFSGDMLYGEAEKDALGFDMGEREPLYFDIDIVPQKQNPFSREANNQTIITLWQSGFFNPQMIDMALIALPAMTFDGRDKIIQALQGYKEQQQQIMMQQQAMMEQQAAAQNAGQFEDLGNGLTAVDMGGGQAAGQFEDLGNGLTAVRM